MPDLINIESLLKEAAPKVKAYLAKRKEEKDRGHAFNIFSIMGMERSEVNTHSAMIAELLNPNGSHGQGDIFLKCFLKCISDCHILNRKGEVKTTMGEYKVAYKTATVKKEEVYRGGKDRVDILLAMDDLLIVIENKIDAKDQKAQLYRYSQIPENSGKNYCLLYLTIGGHRASKKSLGDGGVEYDQISYRKHITQWLNLCLREENTISRTFLQKAILQYFDTVKKITGTNMNSEYEDKMFELLSNEDNLNWAEEISRFIPKMKGKMLDDFFDATKRELEKKKYGFSWVNTDVISKELIWSKGKGKKWFYGETNKQRARNFGLFFDIGVAGVLFYVMVASKALHYGIVNIEKHEGNLPKLVAPSKEGWKKEPEEFKGLKRRDWNSFKWYSHMYEYKKDSWNFLDHPKEFMVLIESNDFFEGMKNTIKKLKNESPSGVDNQLL